MRQYKIKNWAIQVQYVLYELLKRSISCAHEAGNKRYEKSKLLFELQLMVRSEPLHDLKTIHGLYDNFERWEVS